MPSRAADTATVVGQAPQQCHPATRNGWRLGTRALDAQYVLGHQMGGGITGVSAVIAIVTAAEFLLTQLPVAILQMQTLIPAPCPYDAHIGAIRFARWMHVLRGFLSPLVP